MDGLTPEIALWIFGISALPLLGWGIKITTTINSTSRDIQRIKSIVENPEDNGFGNHQTNKIIEDNTRVMRALIHYIKWLVKHQTGEDPPPNID